MSQYCASRALALIIRIDRNDGKIPVRLVRVPAPLHPLYDRKHLRLRGVVDMVHEDLTQAVLIRRYTGRQLNRGAAEAVEG